MDVEFIAHKRESDGKIQTVYEHLNEVAAICSLLTSKIDLPEVVETQGSHLNYSLLTGLVHSDYRYPIRADRLPGGFIRPKGSLPWPGRCA